jgi:hypothetical protein
MLRLFKSLRKPRPRLMLESRRHPRYASLIKVYYLVRGSWYRGSIQNVSVGGLYIRCIKKGKYSTGDPILAVVEFGVLRHQVRGRIIRIGSDGIAVEFDTSEPEYGELKALLTDHCLF